MKHELLLKTDYLGIERSGVELKIKGNGKAIGTMTISNATIKWFPKNSKMKCAEFSWEEFDAFMTSKVK